MALEKPRSRYEQVADQLRAAIKSGRYKPGEMLPSQPTLAREYGLAQTSIGRAIAILKNEGLVRVEGGRGATVLEVPTVKRTRRTRYRGSGGSFAEEMRRAGLEPDTPRVRLDEIDPPPEIATYLQLGGERVMVRGRRMLASGHPMQLATAYIPMSVAGSLEIAEPDTGPTGMYKRLAARGHHASRFVENIEVRSASRDESDFFKIADTAPVLEVVRIAYDQEDKPIEAAVNVFPASQWKLSYEWSADA
ncbi:GntR family transcriptional regulator [Actinorugispora endophytica]|uniref:GntR family transcriptional regulator n=1 Tax=Actinorugispora endophytica TaxID=1605990 RepID=A0A4R6ULI0_9ACTN|nr:GntR family transcriptional regulator [Actinorugispora endophytica]TDQ46005.1 GntR family transcriptional regulator [Actinorugispora endophytica]